MRVTIFGSGYAGLVTGASHADAGNHLVCIDVDQERIDRLNSGELVNIAERFDADLEEIRAGIGSDPRIGRSFMYPSAGYAGFFFLGILQALERSSSSVGRGCA